MKAVLRGALAALLSFLLAAGSAGACCTDLWSCAGAVASAGLTCAEEAAALALRDLARRLTAERDARKQAFEAAVAAETGQANDVSSAWRRSAEDAAADAARSAKRAAEITGNDTRLRLLASSGVSAPSARPTPTPAASRFGALDTTMKARPIGADPTLEELQKRVESEKREVEARRQRAAEQDATARRAIEEAKVWQVAAFTGGVLAGFASLLTQIAILLGSNDKLKQFVLAANVAGLVVEFVKLEKGFEKDLADAAREAARRRAEAADRPRPDALAAEQHAKRARDLVAAMERISRIQSLEQRPQTARELVLAPTGGPAERAPVRLEARAVLAVSSSGAARIAELKKSAEALPATARTPDVAPFRAKVSADLAAQFKGKSAPAAAATRDALLAEARRRFGSDPKTLAGVEKLITDASTVR